MFFPKKITAGERGYLLFFSLALFVFQQVDSQSPWQVDVFKYHKGPVNAVAYHPDGNLLLSASSDKTLKIRDLNQHKIILTIPFEREVHAAAFTPDGKYILTGVGTLLKVYNIQGEYYKTYKGHTTAIWSMAPGPNGRYVVTGSYEKAFILWDIIKGVKVLTYPGHSKSVLAVAFSPDGNHIASGSLDKSVRIWRVGNERGMKTESLHSGNVVALSFSPDGKLLASASRDQKVILWDVETGKKVNVLSHPSEIFSVSFSPDGVYLVSGTLHGDLFLWDVFTGREIGIFKGHTAAVLSLSFHPGGERIASGSYDGTIRIWNPDPEIFVRFAYPDSLKALSERYPGNLSRLEGESKAEMKQRTEQNKQIRKEHILRLYHRYLTERKKATGQ